MADDCAIAVFVLCVISAAGEPAAHPGGTALEGGAGQGAHQLGHGLAPHQPPLLRLPEQVEHHQEGHAQGEQ